MTRPPPPGSPARRIVRDIAVVGASAGGVQALRHLFHELPADHRGVVAAVLHRSPTFSATVLADLMTRVAALPLVEPTARVPVCPGTIYLAPRDHHLVFEDGHIGPTRGPREHFTRPSIDPLFRSAAAIYGSRVVGVILTGGGNDGIAGLITIAGRGGVSLVQEPGDADIPTLPRNALLYDHAHHVLPLAKIPDALARLARGESLGAPRAPEPGEVRARRARRRAAGGRRRVPRA
jgi:two-component system chemotaxis response regulator CheB